MANFRAAIGSSVASSLVAPLVGIATAPMLAHALSVEGRGQLAVAIAPATLMLGLATAGLPEAVTYYVGKSSAAARRVTHLSLIITTLIGGLFLGATAAALPFLSSGDEQLSTYILVCTSFTVPALYANVLRGLATGYQMWGSLALEKVVVSLIKFFGITALFLAGVLTVATGLIPGVAAPIVGLFTFVGAYRRAHASLSSDQNTEAKASVHVTTKDLMSFGGRVWFGAVASILLARVAQLFMAPLSTAEDLGLYVVSSTIADVPLIVIFAIAGALFGLTAGGASVDKSASICRLAFALTALASLAMASSLHWTLPFVFGPSFESAVIPTYILLASAVISVPGTLVASTLAAAGRPELRSIGLALALLVYLVSFFLLVPEFGVVGAVSASFIASVCTSVFMLSKVRRLLGIDSSKFLVASLADIGMVRAEIRKMRLRPQAKS